MAEGEVEVAQAVFLGEGVEHLARKCEQGARAPQQQQVGVASARGSAIPGTRTPTGAP